MSKLTETKVDLTWKGFFGIFGDILTAVGQLLVQIWILNMWYHAERRETKTIPENIKIKIEDKFTTFTNLSEPDRKKKISCYDKDLYEKNVKGIREAIDKNEVYYAKITDSPKIKEIKGLNLVVFGLAVVVDIYIFCLGKLDKERSITVAHPSYPSRNYIIFRDEFDPTSELKKDIRLWLHELVHVHQYSDLGFGSFTWRYGNKLFGKIKGDRMGGEIEDEAYGFDEEIAKL